jgi:hypothetical protein
MFLPPEERRPWYPSSEPDDGLSKRGEAVLLWFVALFLLAVLLGPIGGSTLGQALLALLGH